MGANTVQLFSFEVINRIKKHCVYLDPLVKIFLVFLPSKIELFHYFQMFVPFSGRGKYNRHEKKLKSSTYIGFTRIGAIIDTVNPTDASRKSDDPQVRQPTSPMFTSPTAHKPDVY